ncbi:universal stress protein [Marinococcus luteus]|uniref:universal stress protein n=1 Tax=Marinococcus luteus TaxID=1122204 RepID=UPI002ACC7402|nr:universal stress protein [Marinococcus luteus]MDZ5782054.1 universal stress protein [Marinococcus luteus]
MPLPYQRILVALDGSEESKAGLAKGIETALAYGSALALCHIVDYHSIKELRKQYPDLMLHALNKHGSAIITEGKETAENAGIENVRIFIKEGIPKTVIAGDIAKSFQPDLIISGGSGAGSSEKKRFGSVSAGIVRRASCDVWIVKNSDTSAVYRSVLIAVDGSDVSKNAFYAGLHMAQEHQSQMQVIYVLNTQSLSSLEPYTKDIISEYKTRADELLQEYQVLSDAENHGLQSVHYSVEHGTPKTVIPRDAAGKYQADLIVVGASGMGRTQRFILGSVSESTVRRASCDVLVVRNQHYPE